MVIKDFGMPFNDVASDRLYSAADWQEYFKNLVGNGVVGETGNELAIIQQTVPNKSIIVSTGAVAINGAMRVVDVAFNLTVADNTSGNPRIDRIVARLNTTDRKLEIVVKQGTPGASPSAPTLTQTSTTWEISLAKINLSNGFSSVVTANITDERTYMTYKDRVLNDRMDAFEIAIDGRMDDLEGDVVAVNARMDTMDPAKWYGKYSQFVGGASVAAGLTQKLTFSATGNNDLSCLSLAGLGKITVPATSTKVKLYFSGIYNLYGGQQNANLKIMLYKNGVLLDNFVNDSVYYDTLKNSCYVESRQIVTAGDYFEIYIQTSTGTYNNSSLDAGSIFGIEILG